MVIQYDGDCQPGIRRLELARFPSVEFGQNASVLMRKYQVVLLRHNLRSLLEKDSPDASRLRFDSQHRSNDHWDDVSKHCFWEMWQPSSFTRELRKLLTGRVNKASSSSFDFCDLLSQRFAWAGGRKDFVVQDKKQPKRVRGSGSLWSTGTQSNKLPLRRMPIYTRMDQSCSLFSSMTLSFLSKPRGVSQVT